MLSAEVGQPAEAGRLRFYELLLRYNDAWREILEPVAAYLV